MIVTPSLICVDAPRGLHYAGIGCNPMAYREPVENPHHERNVAATAIAAWQRDLWISYWCVANLLEKQRSPEAMNYGRRAYNTLVAMVENRLFVSHPDMQFLERLRAKVNQ